MARYLSFVISLALASVAALQAVDQNRVTFDPNDFPVEVTQKLMCQSCYAAVKEFDKQTGSKLKGLKKKLSREIVVYDAIDHFCDEDRFFDYTGFPPSFRKGCQAFLDQFNEESIVEDRLVAGGSVERQCKSVCKEVCDGLPEEERFSEYVVDPALFRKRAPKVPGGGVQHEEVTTRSKATPFPEGQPRDDAKDGEL